MSQVDPDHGANGASQGVDAEPVAAEDLSAATGLGPADEAGNEPSPAPDTDSIDLDDGAFVAASDAESGSAPAEAVASELSVEDLVVDLERVTAERDQYLETSRRLQAEFENYRKQVSKRELEARERANEGLISEMLPILDAFDGALTSGVEAVAPMRTTLLDALGKQGLERIDPSDSPFDPNQHEAVMHEDGDGGDEGPIVAEVMRAGYSWKGRVVRPAMVRVRG